MIVGNGEGDHFPITTAEVENALKSLTNGHAPGTCEVTAGKLKYGRDQLVEWLTKKN